jgi:hypothetical protein
MTHVAHGVSQTSFKKTHGKAKHEFVRRLFSLGGYILLLFLYFHRLDHMRRRHGGTDGTGNSLLCEAVGWKLLLHVRPTLPKNATNETDGTQQ